MQAHRDAFNPQKRTHLDTMKTAALQQDEVANFK
jgi:hypothetical protein